MIRLPRLAAVGLAVGLPLGGAATAPASAPPAIVWEPSPLLDAAGHGVVAEAGTLAVPERHEAPGTGTVRLAFLRLRTSAAAPQPPIVFLSGGPGGSGTAAARGALLPLFRELAVDADVLALDQRGTGLARPALVCRESWSHPLERAVDADELLAVARSRSRSCATLLRSQGNDLEGYDTVESADDLEDLRRALGVPKLQLLASSYGTQLALTALRRHPESFTRVVLVSPKGPEHGLRLPSAFDDHLQALAAEVAADPVAHPAFPDVVGELRAVLDRLRRETVRVAIPLPMSKGRAELVVTAFDLQVMVVQAFASRDETAALPARVHRLAQGDFTPLGRFALGLRRGWLGSAMPYLVECSSGLAPERQARIAAESATALLGTAVNFPFPGICSGWQVGELPADWRTPVRSALPVLVIAARHDVRTPLADAREILAGLPAGVLVTVDGFGHGEDFLQAAEVAALTRRFFAGQPVAARTLPFPPLRFALDVPDRAPER